ncbi:MAG: J domain-containing protein [Planctomycetota bacterium]|nr:J domain-containing protein [Planctomycetota bacterium]
MDISHYEILGVEATATFDEIKLAFRRQAKRTHPDKNPDDPLAQQRFIRIFRAYDLLSDVYRRAAYDLKLFGKVHSPPKTSSTIEEILTSTYHSIMDTPADDVLEEYVVGNRPPKEISLRSFFRDLENTDTFILFRDARTHHDHGNPYLAVAILEMLAQRCPQNILYHYYLGCSLQNLGHKKRAERSFHSAILIGELREPSRRCPTIRKALYDLKKSRGKRIAAWWFRRANPDLDHRTQLDMATRERIRLETQECRMRSQTQTETKRLPLSTAKNGFPED